MVTPLSVFIGSVVLFATFSFLVQVERKRGERVVLSAIRNSLDRLLDSFYKKTSNVWNHFVQYVLRLGWYYSLHSLLRTLLRMVVATYDYLESHFEKNRIKARLLRDSQRSRDEDSHLSAVADHKAATALTPAEEAALKEQKLEERD